MIGILLEEYRQMRSEIRSRVASQMQGVAFIGLIASVVAATNHSAPVITVIAITALIIAWAWWRSNNATISSIGQNLAEVERCVNHIAQRKYGAGKPLRWERWSQWQRATESSRTRFFGQLLGYPDPPNTKLARDLYATEVASGASDASREAWHKWVKETEGT